MSCGKWQWLGLREDRRSTGVEVTEDHRVYPASAFSTSLIRRCSKGRQMTAGRCSVSSSSAVAVSMRERCVGSMRKVMVGFRTATQAMSMRGVGRNRFRTAEERKSMRMAIDSKAS